MDPAGCAGPRQRQRSIYKGLSAVAETLRASSLPEVPEVPTRPGSSLHEPPQTVPSHHPGEERRRQAICGFI